MQEDYQATRPELIHIKNGRGKPACIANGGTFIYWDHQLKPHPGLAITPEEYHEQQRKDLRPSAFTRMHQNDFVNNVDQFISSEQWNACYHPDVKQLLLDDGRRAVFGADASVSRDYTALVGVYFDIRTGYYDVVYCKVWRPQKSALRNGKPTIDLNKTIAAEILRLHANHQVASVLYDSYQLHSIASELLKKGVRMVEFPQTARRIESDQGLYDAIIGKNIRHFDHPELNEHILNSVAVETGRGYRLAKDKSSKKIDAAVALSMALHGAREEPQGNIGQLYRERLLEKSRRNEVDIETLIERADRDQWAPLRDF
jgi:phage terminase large subunit-like protein